MATATWPSTLTSTAAPGSPRPRSCSSTATSRAAWAGTIRPACASTSGAAPCGRPTTAAATEREIDLAAVAISWRADGRSMGGWSSSLSSEAASSHARRRSLSP